MLFYIINLNHIDCFFAVNVLWLIVVAVLWGGTNPLLKQGGEGIEHIKKDSAVKQFIAELLFLVGSWKVYTNIKFTLYN